MKFDYSLSNILLGTALTGALVITLPSASMAMTGREINQIARETTVFIGGTDGVVQDQGSGVIIRKKGNTYSVLTAYHVVGVKETDNGEVKYRLVTSDQKEHDVTSITRLAYNVDLAVVEFTSNDNYPVATLAKSDELTGGVPVFVSGWALPTQVGGGKSIRQLSDGRVSTVLDEKESYNGYRTGYTNNTLKGMSGGPVFDAGGRVVAIHGLGDTASSEELDALEEAGIDRENAQKLLKTDFNYGIPINTYLQFLSSSERKSLKIEDTPPPELGANTVAEINQEIQKDPEIDTQAFWEDLGKDVGEVFVEEGIETGERAICKATKGWFCPRR